MREDVRRFIGKHSLLGPGDRVTIACSGGADSVALLRVLVELRAELGLVLSIAHFNHGLRGAEADRDESFVRDLASEYSLVLHAERGDVLGQARFRKLSLETAARAARYKFFERLLAAGAAEKIALAHNANDQAETVLMKLLRGAGGSGIAAMAPWRPAFSNLMPPPGRRCYVRPLLGTNRGEIEAYLRGLDQSWREDATNRSLEHTRNRIRHELLPFLIGEYNPNAVAVLGHWAEIARAEEEFWASELDRIAPTLMVPRDPEPVSYRNTANASEGPLALDSNRLAQLPLALRRRIVRALAANRGESLDFAHTTAVLGLLESRAGAQVQINRDLVARRTPGEIVLERMSPPFEDSYEYKLAVPGAVPIPELATTLKAKLVIAAGESNGYNPAQRDSLPASVTVRNWRAGDRVRLMHSKRDKKVKEILQSQQVKGPVRKLWPVIEASGALVWIRGSQVAPISDGTHEVIFEETKDRE